MGSCDPGDWSSLRADPDRFVRSPSNLAGSPFAPPFGRWICSAPLRGFAPPLHSTAQPPERPTPLRSTVPPPEIPKGSAPSHHSRAGQNPLRSRQTAPDLGFAPPKSRDLSISSSWPVSEGFSLRIWMNLAGSHRFWPRLYRCIFQL